MYTVHKKLWTSDNLEATPYPELLSHARVLELLVRVARDIYVSFLPTTTVNCVPQDDFHIERSVSFCMH